MSLPIFKGHLFGNPESDKASLNQSRLFWVCCLFLFFFLPGLLCRARKGRAEEDGLKALPAGCVKNREKTLNVSLTTTTRIPQPRSLISETPCPTNTASHNSCAPPPQTHTAQRLGKALCRSQPSSVSKEKFSIRKNRLEFRCACPQLVAPVSQAQLCTGLLKL